MRTTVAVMLCFFAWGCGKSDGDSSPTPTYPDYIDQNLQGKIATQNWVFAQGRAAQPAEGFADQVNWSFSLLSDEREDICSGFVLKSVDGLEVIFSREPVVGKQELSLEHNITLFDEADGANHNIVATDGFLELTAVTASEISGKMIAHFDDESTVNGHFSITRCCRDETGFDYTVCTE